MRHVTDGELHAYLDGELEFLPADRGEEVRQHLSQCSVCRERLQDEEKLRTRAGRILEDPGVGGIVLPSFEELRERAEAGAPKPEIRRGDTAEDRRMRSPLTSVPLAWAATVVLALGVGWMGSTMWRTLPTTLSERAGPEAREQAASGPSVEGRAGDATMAAYEPSSAPPAPAGSDSGTAGASQGVVQDSVDFLPSPAGPPSAVSLRLAENLTRPGEPAEERVRIEPVPSDLDARMAKLAQPEAERLTEPATRTRDAESALLDRVARSAEADLGSAAVENALAVPGLEVVSVQWEERIPGERALHVRQLLPTGDTLELRYLGMLLGMDPGQRREVAGRDAGAAIHPDVPSSPQVLKASLPPGWNQVVMRWGRGWLVARAPLTEASLKGLLKSMH